MKFNISTVKEEYQKNRSNWRSIGKWLFSLLTFPVGPWLLWKNTVVIREGEIGLRRTGTGEMVLLPPGRHSNFPWESYPVGIKSLASDEIKMGPYTIVTVESGNVGKTLHKGKLQILGEGQHLLTDASHLFKEAISIKEETKGLHQVQAYTADNVGITLYADVRYQIEDP